MTKASEKEAQARKSERENEQKVRNTKMARQKAQRLAAEAEKKKARPDQFGDLIDINKIEIGDRLRILDLEKVDALAELMSKPRLKAAMKLGWKQIRATTYAEMTDDAAVLAEIDENLIRADRRRPSGRSMSGAGRRFMSGYTRKPSKAPRQVRPAAARKRKV